MSDLYADWERLVKDTVRKLEESTRVVEACAQQIKEQNRKARFIARCLGIAE